jgi:predicted membrane-bound dolichyl-phosphate-mannose-protein mannosyltransferase
MTNNKQQTAVDWFAKKVMHLDWKFSNQKEKEKIIQQAKEMHRQQAIKLHYEYELYAMMNESVVMTFGQFYKQTYGGGEQ